jgi:hypothetical protein
MKLYVERDAHAWNRIVKGSRYSVLHHKYEVFANEKRRRSLPLVFEVGKNRLLFPYELRGTFGFRTASVPVYDYASALPSNSSAIPLLPKALDVTLLALEDVGIDLLTISAPFFMPENYLHFVDKWFEKKGASVQTIFVDALSTHEKAFEDIWVNEFSKHARNRTRKAEKRGVSVREIEVLEEWTPAMYLCNMSSFYRQKRYPRYPHSDKDAFMAYLNWHKKVLGENCRIYGAFFRGRLIAYAVTLEFNSLIVISLLMSLSEFLSKCPNDALLRFLVDHACRDGFEWMCYSFDRTSYSSERRSLHSSLRRFKFEHGFEEQPMKIYFLGLTGAGRLLQQMVSVYNLVFIASSSFPHFVTDALQKIYERRRYRKSRYKYIKNDLQ